MLECPSRRAVNRRSANGRVVVESADRLKAHPDLILLQDDPRLQGPEKRSRGGRERRGAECPTRRLIAEDWLVAEQRYGAEDHGDHSHNKAGKSEVYMSQDEQDDGGGGRN